MEEVIVKKGRKQYIFTPHEIILKKKNKIVCTIKTCDILMIMYNGEFHGIELLVTLITSGIAPPPMPPHLFAIILKGKKHKIIRWWIHPKYIESIQEVIDVPISFYEAKSFC